MNKQDKLISTIFGESPRNFKQWDRVILPNWFGLKGRQGRANIILEIYPAKGYIFMAKALKNGKVSNDRRASVYFPYSSASSLARMDKHEFDTDCSNEKCLYHELSEKNPKLVCPRCGNDMDIVKIVTL